MATTKKERFENIAAFINPSPARPAEADTAEALGTTAGQSEKPEPLRLGKRGRPKGGREGEAKESRATFIVERETMRKLRYISLCETKLYKTVIAEAFGQYIDGYEAKHGKIEFK